MDGIMIDIELLERGGVVVYILIAYSVIGITIVVTKYFHFMSMGKAPTAFDIFNAKKYQGPEMAVILALNNAIKSGIHDLDNIADRIINYELTRLEKGLKGISILANTAPLLGLLGTVTGMMQAFMVIEKAGGKVDANVLAGGIWEAMMTTGAGLSVAIVLMILLHHLEGIVEGRYKNMYHASSLFFERNNKKHTMLGISYDEAHHHHGESIKDEI